MAQPLPRLRMELDFMPSPVEDRPGLMIRDSFGYSDAVIIVPPPLVPCLEFFDGEQTELELKAYLVRASGQLDVEPVVRHLLDALHSSAFLEDDLFFERRDARRREFAEAPVRLPAHAGSGYPEEPEPLTETMRQYMGESAPNGANHLAAIAAPHVSPFGGYHSYRAAYSALDERYRDRTFVVLGTSHYGQADRFGLTRKPFVTPFGETRTALGLVDELASQPAAMMEDYCHSVEHSIEFQVVFLQHLFGPDVRILPLLCGPYARSIYQGGMPEENEEVRRFLDALGEIHAREGDRLLWVLGIDMAHRGRRYNEGFSAVANTGAMLEVAGEDKARMERAAAGDAAGFWDMVQQNQDPQNWCGSSPLYTFLRAAPGLRGEIRHYEQWNIDPHSVVSFAGMTFSRE